MTNTRPALVFRILAITFSVALATAYIACQGENREQSDDDSHLLPGTKSAPMDYNTGNSVPDDGEEEADESADPEAEPVLLPGSKSLKIQLPPSDGHTKPKDARPFIKPDSLEQIEEEPVE